MNCSKWTLALISAGCVSLPAIAGADEAVKTTPSLLTGLSATTLSGYVDTSMHWNPGTGNANLPIYTANGAPGGVKADGFNLNAVEVTLSKPAMGDGWSAGYNSTLVFGPDALAYNTSFGSTYSDFALKDTYVDLHAPIGPNGLGVKIGTFSTILGYEVFETGNNPNYTRSYGYAMEPTALTGVLGTYVLCPEVTLNGGIANTWSPGINTRNFLSSAGGDGNHTESFKTYMGSVVFTAPERSGFLTGSTLSLGFTTGYDAIIDENVTSYYAGSTINTPLKNLKAGVSFDLLDVAQASGENWAVGTYLLYGVTEKLSLNARAEYLRSRGDEKFLLTPEEVMELTFTASYDLWKNVLTRLEVRWDHDLTNDGFYGGDTFGAGTEDNAVVVAANIIYKF
jgi:hypothetical protein